MSEKQTKTIASAGLFIGGLFGMIGSFVPFTSFRGVCWGLDGVSLIVATSLLTIYYFRKEYDSLAAGFFIFTIGECLILSGSAADLDESIPSFGAGTSLWATSLILISFQDFSPKLIRLTGLIAAVLFSIISIQIFTGSPINALTKPLPFYAYPFFVITIFGWAWNLVRIKSF